jgi:hypothetical protein
MTCLYSFSVRFNMSSYVKKDTGNLIVSSKIDHNRDASLENLSPKQHHGACRWEDEGGARC